MTNLTHVSGTIRFYPETIIAVANEIMSDLSGYMADDLSTDDRMEAADMVQRILAAIQPEALSGWQPIDKTPDNPMPVLLFCGHGRFRHGDEWISATDCTEPYREERVIVGFWDGFEWCENGTGHDAFEDWRAPYWHPTHWIPLPEPPK